MNLFKIQGDYFNLDLLVRISKRAGTPRLIREETPDIWELGFVGFAGSIAVSNDEMNAVLAAIERGKLSDLDTGGASYFIENDRGLAERAGGSR